MTRRATMFPPTVSDPLQDRLASALFGAAASLMLFAGAASFVACVPAFALGSMSAELGPLAALALALGGVFFAAGAGAAWLSRPRAFPVLPNEREPAPGAARPPLGGWLVLLALFLAVLPLVLVFALRPFLAEWSNVVRELEKLELGGGGTKNESALVLLPIAGALLPPFLELLSLACVVVTSPLLLLLLTLRSARFPRLYATSSVLLGGLVVASFVAVRAAMRLHAAAVRLVAESSATPEEAREIQAVLDRYATAVRDAEPVLLVALVVWLAWLPALLTSRRARATFAPHS